MPWWSLEGGRRTPHADDFGMGSIDEGGAGAYGGDAELDRTTEWRWGGFAHATPGHHRELDSLAVIIGVVVAVVVVVVVVIVIIAVDVSRAGWGADD